MIAEGKDEKHELQGKGWTLYQHIIHVQHALFTSCHRVYRMNAYIIHIRATIFLTACFQAQTSPKGSIRSKS